VGLQAAIFWVVLIAGPSRPADVMWLDAGPVWSSPRAAGTTSDGTPAAALVRPRPTARPAAVLASPQPVPTPPPTPLKPAASLANPVRPPTTPAARIRIAPPTLLPARSEPGRLPAAVEATLTRATPIVVADGRRGVNVTYRLSQAVTTEPTAAARLTAPSW
jgi:hypothetical protein